MLVGINWAGAKVAAEVRRDEGRMEDVGEDKDIGCWLLSIMAHVTHSKINWKLMHARNILDFEIEIFWHKTYQILRLKNQLRPLRLVFAWSLIFENGDGPKTGPQLRSWSVLGSDPVSVFFQSWGWTSKHYSTSSKSSTFESVSYVADKRERRPSSSTTLQVWRMRICSYVHQPLLWLRLP